jgi:hypothetical protein
MESVEYYNGFTIIKAYSLDYLLNPSQELAESMSTGPQDEFFESLDTFNRHLPEEEQLAVTRTWRWKAGSFDIVKKRMFQWLQIDRKPSSLTHLVQRTKDRAHYMNYYCTNLEKLERLKSNLKSEGYTPNVDVDKFKENINAIVVRIKEQIDSVFKMTEGNIKIDVLMSNLETPRNADIYIDLYMENLEMSIFDGNKCIQKLPLHPIHIIGKISFRKFMLTYSKAGNYLNTLYFTGFYHSPLLNDSSSSRIYHETEFPYIASPYRRVTSGESEYTSVCLDNYTDDVKNQFFSLNWVEMAMTFMSWAQYYHTTHSNPYNTLGRLHLGVSKDFPKEYQSIVGFNSTCPTVLNRKFGTSDCSEQIYEDSDMVKLEEFTNYCDSIKCIHVFNGNCRTNKLYSLKVAAYNIENKQYLVETFIGFVIEDIIKKSEIREYFNFNYNQGSSRYYTALYYYLRAYRNFDKDKILDFFCDYNIYDKYINPYGDKVSKDTITNQPSEAEAVMRWATGGH